MGLIINLTYENGLNLNSAYINIKKMTIRKVEKFYVITIEYNIYLNYQSKLEKRVPLYIREHIITIDELPVYNINHYCYFQLKELYKPCESI